MCWIAACGRYGFFEIYLSVRNLMAKFITRRDGLAAKVEIMLSKKQVAPSAARRAVVSISYSVT